MTALRFTLLAAVAALAAAALPGSSLAGNECNGVPKCISVPGPWVFVPVRGEAGFLLECPGRRGVVAGLDAQVTSQDVRVTFDGLIASPVAAGRTTTRYAFFRAVSSSGKRGAFEPRLGCIPSNTSRNTLAATPIKPLGAPLDLAAATLVLEPGSVQRRTLACTKGEHLVSSWDALTFATAEPPELRIADDIHIARRTRAGRVTVIVTTSGLLTGGEGARVQVGVRCAG